MARRRFFHKGQYTNGELRTTPDDGKGQSTPSETASAAAAEAVPDAVESQYDTILYWRWGETAYIPEDPAYTKAATASHG